MNHEDRLRLVASMMGLPQFEGVFSEEDQKAMLSGAEALRFWKAHKMSVTMMQEREIVQEAHALVESAR